MNTEEELALTAGSATCHAAPLLQGQFPAGFEGTVLQTGEYLSPRESEL